MAHPTRFERVTFAFGGQRGPHRMTCRSCRQQRSDAEKKRALQLHWSLSFHDAADTDVVVTDQPSLLISVGIAAAGEDRRWRCDLFVNRRNPRCPYLHLSQLFWGTFRGN